MGARDLLKDRAKWWPVSNYPQDSAVKHCWPYGVPPPAAEFCRHVNKIVCRPGMFERAYCGGRAGLSPSKRPRCRHCQRILRAAAAQARSKEEVWGIVHARKGPLTVRLCEDVDPTVDFFAAEIIAGRPIYLSNEARIGLWDPLPGPGDTISMRQSLVRWKKRLQEADRE